MQLELDPRWSFGRLHHLESDVAQELAKSLDLELTDWHLIFSMPYGSLSAVWAFPATRPLIKF